MDRLIYGTKIYIPHEYNQESEFEKQVIQYSNEIFGLNTVYIDVKKRIGNDNILTIPDGYLIDVSFKADPRLYIIENELVIHDPYKHIGQQLLKFAISYKASGRLIKKFLLDNILKSKNNHDIVSTGFKKGGYRNIDAFLEDLIFEKPVAAIVIIDKITPDLESVLSQLSMKTDILEFQTFVNNNELIHKFTPFQEEIRIITESIKPLLPLEDCDTIVVPANEDGFNEAFIGENCWYQIRISSSMLSRIKYIAAYQTAPISAITHFAEVARIEKYKDTNKYIIFFKEPAKEFGPIKLSGKKKSGRAPQSPRYTSYRLLMKAKTLNDIF